MKVVVTLLSIIVFITCLLIGIQAGNDSLKITDSAPTALPASQQRTILVILTDDLQSKTPRLVGLWTVFYRPDIPHIMGMILYPSNQDPDDAATLNHSFSISANGVPTPAFFDSLKSYHFQWDGYILLDLSASAYLVDAWGGVSFGDQTLAGKAATATLQMPWDDSKRSLNSQKAFGAAICNRLSDSKANLDWRKIVKDLPPKHAHFEWKVDQLETDWKTLNQQDAPLQCEWSAPETS